MWYIFEVCVCYRLSIGELVGFMWEKEFGRKEVLGVFEENGVVFWCCGFCLAYFGGDIGEWIGVVKG